MLKLCEEGAWKAKTIQKLFFLCQAVLCRKYEGKFQEIKSFIPVNPIGIGQWYSFIANKEKILVSLIEDQTSHSIPSRQRPTQILWRLREEKLSPFSSF